MGVKTISSTKPKGKIKLFAHNTQKFRINQKALEYIFVREVIADMKTTFQNGRVLLNKSEKEIQGES